MIKNELIEAMKKIPNYMDAKKKSLVKSLQNSVMLGNTRLSIVVFAGSYFSAHDVISFCEENNLNFKQYYFTDGSICDVLIYWDEEL